MLSRGGVDGEMDALVLFQLFHLSEENANRVCVLWQDKAKMTFRALEVFESRARIAL